MGELRRKSLRAGSLAAALICLYPMAASADDWRKLVCTEIDGKESQTATLTLNLTRKIMWESGIDKPVTYTLSDDGTKYMFPISDLDRTTLIYRETEIGGLITFKCEKFQPQMP